MLITFTPFTLMTYQNKLRPWCIVQQLPEMKRVIIDRFRHYQDAGAR